MLSVVMPNFNHARFLPDALHALLAQTHPAEELIIIDDASTDDSLSIIESFLPKFSNAKLVHHGENVGVVRNMNIGLRMAQGTSIVFAAADDIVYPTFFERMLALLQAYPQAGFASAGSALINAAGDRVGVLKHSVPMDRPGYIDPRSAARHLMQDDAWFSGNATVFRRRAILEIGGFPEELSALTDGYVSRLLAVKFGACYSPEILAAWRRMEGGVAWSQTADVIGAEELAALAERRMRESGLPFVHGYSGRWKGRFLFGVRRAALVHARRKAQMAGIGPFARALVNEVVQTTWLLVMLRPNDIVAIPRRWLKHWWSDRAARKLLARVADAA